MLVGRCSTNWATAPGVTNLNKKFKGDESRAIRKCNKNKNQINPRDEQNNDWVEKLDKESLGKTHLCGRNCEWGWS
jgi:hypothetical protein